MIFIEIEEMKKELVNIRKIKWIPFCFKRFYIDYKIKQIVETYNKALEKVPINYDIIRDFSIFYLNTIGITNGCFKYKLLKDKIYEITMMDNSIDIKFDKKTENISYHLTFRNYNNDINITIKEKTVMGIDIPYGYMTKYVNRDNSFILTDEHTSIALKQEMIKYISYYLRTYAFI